MSQNNLGLYPGWETVRKIGSGSYGAVYEIERDVFGKTEKAALKVLSIPRDMSEIEELVANGYDRSGIKKHFECKLSDIVREYQFMADMKGSSNIVDCDDIRYIQKASGVGWDIYIKMELLTPLTRVLEDPMTEEQVIKVGKDICKALILCEKRNIIHRDIKPQNIFVSKDGEYKLGDFGIAKTIESTSGGTKAGTTSYMAPEINNNEPYGHAADIYSLGMTLYWMLNQKRIPFLPLPPEVPTAKEKERAIYRRFRGDPLPSPVNGSEALQNIILKACEYDPRERYHTAEEFLEALVYYEWCGKDPSTYDRDHNAKNLPRLSVISIVLVIFSTVLFFIVGMWFLFLRDGGMINRLLLSHSEISQTIQPVSTQSPESIINPTAERGDYFQSNSTLEEIIKSAEQGNADAAYNLGVCYEYGKGILQDYKKAVEWYTEAAKKGNANAQYNLGVCYEVGKGVKQNYKKAAEWYTKAAEQGHLDAQFILGVCYEYGIGVQQDYKKATEWYKKASE